MGSIFNEDGSVSTQKEVKKSNKAGLLAGIVVIVALLLVGFYFIFFFPKNKAPLDISEETSIEGSISSKDEDVKELAVNSEIKETVYENAVVYEEEAMLNEVLEEDIEIEELSDAESVEIIDETPDDVETSGDDFIYAGDLSTNDYTGMSLTSGDIISGLDLVNFINGNPQYYVYVNSALAGEVINYVNGGAQLSDIPHSASFKVEESVGGYVFTQVE